MVKIDQKFNLNHIYPLALNNAVLAIGASAVGSTEELELFEKSLALTSDLKKLPVLRGLSGDIYIDADIMTYFVASGIIGMSFRLRLYNSDVEGQDDDENLIHEWPGFIVYDATNHFFGISLPQMTWDYEGAVLLFDKLSIKLDIESKGNVSSTNFPTGAIKARLFLEVDWVSISAAQFKDYILENVYAKQ